MNLKIKNCFASWRAGRPALMAPVMAIVLAVATMSCAVLKPAQNETHHFLLTSVLDATAQTNLATSQNLAVRIQPVELADYLQTQEMAVRSGANEITFSLYHRWAEPLDAGIRRVLAANLHKAAGIREVLAEQTPPAGAVCALAIRVLACEGKMTRDGGSAEFTAAWEITGPDPQNTVLAHGYFRAKPLSWNRSDYGELAAQLSRELGQFSQVLTNALGQVRNASSQSRE